MIWFLLFLLFCFIIPFKWWQSSAQGKDLASYYEKQLHDLRLSERVYRERERQFQEDIVSLRSEAENARGQAQYFLSLFSDVDNRLDEISDYIYGNGLETTPLGEAILSIIEADDSEDA